MQKQSYGKMPEEIIIIGSGPLDKKNLFSKNANFKFVNLSFRQVNGKHPEHYELFVSKYIIRPCCAQSAESKRALDDSKLEFKKINLRINVSCMIWILQKIGFEYFKRIYIQSRSEFFRELKRWLTLNPCISSGYKVILWVIINNRNLEKVSCYGFSLDEFANYPWYNTEFNRGHLIQDGILYKYLVDERVRFHS